MDLGSAVGRITLDYDGAGAAAAKSDMAALESQGARIGAGMALGGAAISKAGQQITGVLGAGLQMATDFEFGVDAVNAALGGIDVEALAQVEQQALDLGASSKFSATEIQGVQEQLAKSGLSVDQILGGATQAVADLASATGEDLVSSSAAAAGAMNMFGLSGEQITAVADSMTAGMNLGSASLADFTRGVNYLGPVMANLANYADDPVAAMTDTNAAVAYFNSLGLSASNAGNSLARGLQNLATPTGKAAELMAELGFSAFDAQGNFIGFPALMDQLNASMAGMSDSQREAALATLFGAQASDVMNIAVKKGGDGLREYEERTVAAGQAAEQAAIRQENLASATEQMGGAVESLAIKAFTPFLEGLTAMVDGITAAINAFASLPTGVLQALATVAGAAGLVAAIGGAAIAAAGGVLLFNAALAGTGLTLGALLGPLALVAAAIAALAIAYQTNFLGLGDAIDGLIAGAKKAAKTFGDTFGKAFAVNQANGFNALGSAISAFSAALLAATGIDISEWAGPALMAIQALDDGFWNATNNGFNPAAAALGGLANAATELGLDDLASRLYEAQGAAQQFGDIFAANKDIAEQSGMTGLSASIQAVGIALSDLLGIDVSGPFTAVANAIQAVADAAGRAGEAIRAALGSALAFVGSNVLPGVVSVLGNVLGTIRDLGAELVSGDFSQAGQILGDAMASLGEWAGNVVQGLGDALGSVDFGGIAATIGAALGSALSGIGDVLSGVNLGAIASSVGTAIQGALGAVGSFLGGAAEIVGNALGGALGAIGAFITETDFAGILQSVSGALLSAFNAGGEWLSSVASTIGTQLGGALNTIGDFLGDIDFGAVIATVGEALGNAFAGGGEFLSGVAQAVGSALATALSTVGDFLGALNFGGLVTAVTDAITAAFGGGGGQHVGSGQVGGGGAFAGIAQSIGEALGSALSGIGEFIGDVNVEGAAETVRSAIETAFNGMQFNLGALATTLASAVEAASGIDLTGVFEAIGAAVDTALTAVGEFATVIGTYMSRIQEALEAIDIPEQLTEFGAFIGDLATDLATGVADKVQALADAIATLNIDEAVAAAMTTLGSAIAAIGDAFAAVDIGAKVTDLGDALATITIDEALAAGLNAVADAFGNIATKVGEAVTALQGWVTNAPTDEDITGGKSWQEIADEHTAGLMEAGGLLASDQGQAAAGMGGDFAANFIQQIASSFAMADWSAVTNAINTGLQSALGGGFAGQGGPRDMGPSEGAGVGGTFAAGLIQSMALGLTPEAFAPLKTAFDAGLAAAFTAPSGGQGQEGGAGAGVAQSLVAGIAAGLGQQVETLRSALQAVVQAAAAGIKGEGLQAAGQAIIAGIASGFGPATGTMTSALTAVLAAVQAAATAAAAQFVAVGTAIATHTGAGLGQGTGTVISAIQAVILAAVSAGTAAAAQAVTVGTTMTTQIGAGLGQNTGAVISAMQAVVGAAIDAGVAAGAGAARIGENIVAGIVAGINSGAGAVAEAVRTIVAAGIAAGVAEAEIASPSEATKREIGIPMAQGVAVGIEEGTPEAEAAGATMGATTVQAIAASVIERLQEAIPNLSAAFAEAFGIATEAGTEAVAAEGEAIVDEVAATGEEAGTSFGDQMASAMLGRMTLGGDGIGGQAIQAILGQLDSATAAVAETGRLIGQTLGEGVNAGMGAALDPLAMIPEGVGRDVAERLIEQMKARQSAYLPQLDSFLAERNRHAADVQERGQPLHITLQTMLDGQVLDERIVETSLGGLLDGAGRNPSIRRRR